MVLTTGSWTVFIAQVVKITEYFVKARDLIEAGEFSQDQAFLFDEAIHKLHPANRGLDTGFYDYEPDRVK